MPAKKELETLAKDIIKKARDKKDASVLYATPDFVATPAKVLDGIEKEIGVALPPEIRAFYSGTEQLGLVWQEGAGAKETKKQPKDWAALCDTDGEYWRTALRPVRDASKNAAMICIPTATEVFQKGYWLDRIVPEPSDDEIEIDGETFVDKDVYESLFPFDFIGTYYIAGLWHNTKKNEWRVMLGDDHGACWTDYKTLSVAEYLGQLATELGGIHRFGEDKEFWALRKD
jgi:hypothetical protein